MKAKLPLIARILLGLIFSIFGLIGLFNLIPPPSDMPEAMLKFNEGLMASRYFFPFLKLTEITCGLLLLSGYFVPLALVVLAPIVINILLVHAFMAPEGIVIGLIAAILLAYLSFFAKPYSDTIKLLFKKK